MVEHLFTVTVSVALCTTISRGEIWWCIDNTENNLRFEAGENGISMHISSEGPAQPVATTLGEIKHITNVDLDVNVDKTLIKTWIDSYFAEMYIIHYLINIICLTSRAYPAVNSQLSFIININNTHIETFYENFMVVMKRTLLDLPINMIAFSVFDPAIWNGVLPNGECTLLVSISITVTEGSNNKSVIGLSWQQRSVIGQ